MNYEMIYEKTHTLNIGVEADNPEDARIKADEILSNNTNEDNKNNAQEGRWELVDTIEEEVA